MSLPQLSRLKRNGGFSFLEILVVMLLVIMLAGFLAPSLTRMRERARRVQCMSNLRQIGLAQYQYANDNNGQFFCAGGPVLGGALGSSSGWAWMGMSNYLASTSVLFCPSALTKQISFPPANQSTNTWSGIANVHNHYGYVCYLNGAMPPSMIMAFETPNYYFHERGFGLDTFGPMGPPFDSLQIALGTGEAFKSDGTPLFLTGPKPETETAHGNTEGSNILFVDGRVEWKRGSKIGPFPTYSLPDIPGRWWSATGWGCIVQY